MKKRLLITMLAFVACLVGFTAWAQSFTVTNSGNTFTIKRSGSNLPAQTVRYRTVSLSALAGVHFTAVSDELNFPAGVDSMAVTVSETSVTLLALPYRYQSSTSRTYRFEVLDKNGSQLAYKDRDIIYGSNYKVSNSYLNKSVTDLVYFNNSGSIQSGSGNKYLDVSYSSSNWVQVTDAGYSQGVHTVSTSSLFNNNSGLRTYLNSVGYKMYATVYFTQKEEQDGYQYIQILADNSSTYDGNDPNGAVNDPSTSLYKACFILSYENSGSVMSDAHHQFFPHRYNYVDKAAELAAGISHYEFDYDDSHLYQQKYQSSSYNASNTGSLNLSPTVNNLNIRFDAAGSGGDNWDFKDLKVRLALVDATTPSRYGDAVVSAGPYNVGRTFTVSIPFNEIMIVSGTPTLTTSWGTMTYMAGSGSNVLTFQGTIDAPHGTALRITGYSGTIRDYVGNDFEGTIIAVFNNLTARARYNFNSVTGVLSLNYGEFNSNDMYWGSEVVRDAVKSVTATNEVSFTGDCSRMFSAFNNCTSIDIINVNTSNVTDMSHMFSECWSLDVLDVSNFNTSNVTDMNNMFYNCSALTTLDVSGFNTANVTNMREMFSECHTLTSINVSGWNTSKVEDMSNMFYRCLNLSSINLSVFNTSSVTDMSYMFSSCAGFTTLSLSNWNTSQVTNLEGMFSGCINLVTLYISTWDVSKVTNMKFLFNNCASLSIPSLSNWNTSNVTDMSFMFGNCSSATSVNISNWNTAKVTNMEAMFRGCSSLYQIPVASWNTARVTNMGSLFEGCSGINSCPVTRWNTESVTNMSRMFYGCSKLTKLYLSIWDTHNVTNMNSMFQNCSLLNTIYAGTAWSLESVTSSSNMFSNCSALVGGNGTAYNSSFTDMSRAVIDKPDEPGYLTGVYALTLPEDVSSTPSPVTTVNEVKYYQAGTEVTLSYNGTPPQDASILFIINGEPIEGDTFTMPFENVTVDVENVFTSVPIDSINFPDKNFRNFLLAQDYGSDGVLTNAEIAGITEMNINGQQIADLTGIGYFVALEELWCAWNSMTTIDMSQNTALQVLRCYANSVTSLNLSQNTALRTLECYNDYGFGQLAVLDVSHNTALTVLDCHGCKLTSLDVSHNAALANLNCNSNQLTSLNVSQNTALKHLDCSRNQLTSLNLSQNTALTWINCYNNQINAENMEALVDSLPTIESYQNGIFSVINLDSETEQNVITTTQVATARGKNWKVYGIINDNWEEYDGSEPITTVPGDVDGDGYVTTVDITAIYNYLLNGDETFLSTSDVDGDGFITTTDITMIYNILLGN
ncbi:MAG: BspA family leucine-rich repeat surface protein [Muribaculaceae bacterium]|nr:BspA family leucine-rich repeat surface protein [Muribaculaceae bacterium]